MGGWFRFSFGFSWIGLAFLACLFVPNLLFVRDLPAGFEEASRAEPLFLTVPERAGEAAVCVLLLFCAELKLQPWSAWSWWLVAAWAFMALYLTSWAVYFAGPHTLPRLYEPFAGIPLPLAVLPVAAAVLLGVYARSFWLILAGAALGFGHIGVHILGSRRGQ